MAKNEISKDRIEIDADDSNYIVLGNAQVLNLKGLPENVKIELRKQHASTFLDLQKKASELGIEASGLQARMCVSVNTVSKASADGNSATVTGVYKDTLGNTEFMVGNTETAQKGKISSAQRGNPDNTLKYVIIGAIVVIVLAFIIFKK